MFRAFVRTLLRDVLIYVIGVATGIAYGLLALT